MQRSTSQVIHEMALAGYPALYLLSPEDILMRREIKTAADSLKRSLYVWTLGKGIMKEQSNGQGKIEQDTAMPSAALSFMGKNMTAKNRIYVLRHFHHYLDDPNVQAKFLDLLQNFKMSEQMVIILTPVLKIPAEIEKDVSLVETSLPDAASLTSVLDGIVDSSQLSGRMVPQGELKKTLIESALGMTTSEAENAFSLAAVRPKLEKYQDKTPWDPNVVMEEKVQSLRKTGLLDYIPGNDEGMRQIGGMEGLKEWFSHRRRAFTQEARQFGLPNPKGVLVVGPPGSGKSKGAMAVASELKLPLIKLDIGKMFGSLVGQSEANMRMAIKTAEAISPCILWVDEIEKGLAGTTGGSHDSGVGARILGTLLTWMQEKQAPVFVYATANEVTNLPPELLRKGRFDEMFSVLLPQTDERVEIFDIHIRKRGRGHLIDSGKIDLSLLAQETDGFSGAEIEAAIVEAMFSSFHAEKDLNQFDLDEAISAIKPLSETMGDKLRRIEEWCRGRTRPANKVVVFATPTTGRVIDPTRN